ncbi:MAG: hypothetical protein GEU28_06855 [Dehalococcoidia bacterium]|nr:hypothetical protein [Dehalococcoidia bacterium]
MGSEVFGVVSLPGQQHYQAIKALWREIETKFGIPPIERTIVPHFTHHCAERYDGEQLERLLTERAQELTRFTVPCGPVAIANAGDYPVFFLVLARSPALARIHEELWQDLEPLGEGIIDRYAPETWLPHITLTPDGFPREHTGDLAAFLSEQDFEWEVEVDNFTLLHDTGERQQVEWRVLFGGGTMPTQASADAG